MTNERLEEMIKNENEDLTNSEVLYIAEGIVEGLEHDIEVYHEFDLLSEVVTWVETHEPKEEAYHESDDYILLLY